MKEGIVRLWRWVFDPYYMESHCPRCGARFDGFTRKLVGPIILHCLGHIIKRK